MCSKLTIKTPERRQSNISYPLKKFYIWLRSGVFIVNFEHISHLSSSLSIVNFEHVIVGWVKPVQSFIQNQEKM